MTKSRTTRPAALALAVLSAAGAGARAPLVAAEAASRASFACASASAAVRSASRAAAWLRDTAVSKLPAVITFEAD